MKWKSNDDDKVFWFIFVGFFSATNFFSINKTDEMAISFLTNCVSNYEPDSLDKIIGNLLSIIIIHLKWSLNFNTQTHTAVKAYDCFFAWAHLYNAEPTLNGSVCERVLYTIISRWLLLFSACKHYFYHDCHFYNRLR